jgi:hypothetical protein
LRLNLCASKSAGRHRARRWLLTWANEARDIAARASRSVMTHRSSVIRERDPIAPAER